MRRWLLLVLLASSGPAAAREPDVCRHYARIVAQGVPAPLLKQALRFLTRHGRSVARRELLSIADYGRESTEERFFVVDLARGAVARHRVSHGSGEIRGVRHGDPQHDGRLDRCKVDAGTARKGNTHRRANMTRPGFFVTSELYHSGGEHVEKRRRGRLVAGWPTIARAPRANALRLEGLTSGVNDDALTRGVVMHGAWYNQSAVMGRSYGCPAFPPEEAEAILTTLAGGTLYYASAPVCADDMRTVLGQVEGWERMCE